MPTKDEWDIVMALVAKMSPALVSQMLLFVEGRAASDWVDEVAEAVQNGDWNAVVQEILPPSMVERFGGELALAVRTVNESFGTEMAKTLRPLKPVIGPPVEFRFDVMDERVIGLIQRQSTGLLKDMTDTIKAGVRQHLTNGVRRKLPPKVVAQTLFDDRVVGLSARGAQAVANYRALLEGTDRRAVLAGALRRELRDRRYDSVVQRAMDTGTRLSAEKINAMVLDYSDKLLRHELQTLALTETLQAHETVKQHLWLDAITRGYIDPKQYVKKWYVAKDERTCPICTGIAKAHPNGVPITGFFKTPAGLAISGPLAHPRCRCITLVTAVKP